MRQVPETDKVRNMSRLASRPTHFGVKMRLFRLLPDEKLESLLQVTNLIFTEKVLIRILNHLGEMQEGLSFYTDKINWAWG
jgi:hypothetical protein